MMAPIQGVPQRTVRVEPVGVAPPDPLPGQVPLLLKLTDDALRRTLGHPHQARDVPQQNLRVGCHAQQNMGVIGEKGPLRHHPILPFHPTRFRIRIYRITIRAMFFVFPVTGESGCG